MTPLTGLGEKPFENIMGKGEITYTISPFPTMFSTLSKTEIIIFVTFVTCKCLVQNFVMREWVDIVCMWIMGNSPELTMYEFL